jgi:hypothetical protein
MLKKRNSVKIPQASLWVVNRKEGMKLYHLGLATMMLETLSLRTLLLLTDRVLARDRN